MRRTLLLATLALVAAPAIAGETVVDRNRALLLGLLPEGAAMEVQVFDALGRRTEAWSREAFADFRAGAAARMGRDYAAPAENPPACQPLPGPHECELVMGWQVRADLWGAARVNFAVGGVVDAEGGVDHHGCADFGSSGVVCSAVIGWPVYNTLLGVCYSHHLGHGQFFVFGAPFGGLFTYDGEAHAEAYTSSHVGPGGCV